MSDMSVESCIILQVILLLIVKFDGSAGQCSIRWPSCGNDENIVCKTNYGQPTIHCKIIEGNAVFRRAIAETHNYYRNLVAIGNETRGAFQNIADMLAMSYDSDLEFTAQCQASGCNYDHDAKCYITSNFSEVGQNLNGRVFDIEQNHTFDTAEETKNMVSDWYEYEITESNEKVFQDYSRMKMMLIGYLYQMLWAESYRVGCGRSVSEERFFMMICNYGPRGLKITRPLGKIGRPCTRCPEEMSCNDIYIGLCGEIDESHYHITVSGTVSRFCSAVHLCVIIFFFVIFGVCM